MQEAYDAIVVGGGPAGSLSALFLARLGWEVAIIERGPRHRAKTCGHCLSPRAMPILERAGMASKVRQAACGEYRDGVLHVPGRDPLRLGITQPRGDGGLLIERSTLDQLLLDAAAAAGATVFQPFRACAVDLAERAVTAARVHVRGDDGHRLRAGLIVGAGGLRCAVARPFCASSTRRRAGRRFGFSFTMDRPLRARSTEEDLAPGAVHMILDRGAYLGMVRQQDGGIHVGGLIDALGGLPSDPFERCRAMAGQSSLLRAVGLDTVHRDRVHQFVAAGPMPWRAARVAVPGAALVGDAAGYIEPFTGEGMTWAMESAEVLASVATESMRGVWSAESAKTYREAWQRRIGARHRWCAVIAAIIAQPRAIGALIPFLAAAPAWSSAVARRAVPA